MDRRLEETFYTYVKGAFPLILVDTLEADRATMALYQLTQQWNKKLPSTNVEDWLKTSGYRFKVWNIIKGIANLDGSEAIPNTQRPALAVQYISDITKTKDRGTVYVLQNFHFSFQTDPSQVPVLVQSFMAAYQECRHQFKHIFVIASSDSIPAEIRRFFAVMEFPLPSKEEMSEYLSDYFDELGLTFPKKTIQSVADSAAGMTLPELEGAVCVSLTKSKGKEIDLNAVFEEKSKVVKKSGFLEHVPVIDTMDSVGGLVYAKDWIRKVAAVFHERERADKYHMPIPKGAILAGISGTGKSLFAKATASLFRLPLFRWDIGTVFGGLVGSTERNLRECFKLIDAMSPCNILIDEVEKALAGLGSSDRSDAGVTARVIGNLLYYLEEKKSFSFIVCTANDVTTLPVELTRKGRMDAIFFVDLPSLQDRIDTLRIHISKVGRNPDNFKGLKDMMVIADGLTGAEIEACIKEAMFTGFAENREFTSDDIRTALEEMKPLVEVKAKEVEVLREWAKRGARKANDYRSAMAVTDVTEKGRKRTIIHS